LHHQGGKVGRKVVFEYTGYNELAVLNEFYMPLSYTDVSAWW